MILLRNIWNRFIKTENVFLAALLVSTTLLLAQQGLLWRLDQYIYDVQMKLWQRAPSNDIIIVAVDKVSMDKLGNWPWPADYYTALLSQLGQDNPRAVAFYLPLPLSDTITHQPDSELLDALRSTRKPALSVTLNQYADITAAEELSDYLSSNSINTVGHINVLQDQDGIVRSTYLVEGLPNRLWNNLNLLVSEKEYDQPDETNDVIEEQPLEISIEQQKIGYDRRLIPFSGPPGHIQRMPYYKIVAG